MTLQVDDTIAAIASAPGPALRGLIRISGPEAAGTLRRVFQPDEPRRFNDARLPARHAGRLLLQDSAAELPADVYFWPIGRSYTGQPMAEVHVVGSPPLLEGVLGELFAAGARPARPGEFTLRSFLAGRIDLMQAEAVLGVIDAHDFEELKTALGQLAGGLSGRIAEVRSDLIDLLADLEAGLDFVEEDIEFVSAEELAGRLDAARATLAELLEQSRDRMQSTGRLRVVLAGLPNAGKSTLFNALAGQESALVSEIEGTTRDYLRAELDFSGIAIELIDTAGWETVKVVEQSPEQAAQLLRDEQMQQADLILWCSAADLKEPLRELDARLRGELQQQDRPLACLLTKCELWIGMKDEGSEMRDNIPHPSSLILHPHMEAALPVSAVTGSGLSELVERAARELSDSRRGSRHLVGSTAARCRESLQRSVDSLERAQQAAAAAAGDELVAVELHETLGHLGAILGTVYTDDILDRIFSRFCIGK